MGRDPSKTFSARRDRAQFDKVTRKAQAKPEAHSSHEGEPASEADAEVYSHFYDDTGWKGSATPPSNPFMPFIEDGWSLHFAEFCILHDVKVEVRWTDGRLGPLHVIATLKSGKTIYCSPALKGVRSAHDVQLDAENQLKGWIEHELWQERFKGSKVGDWRYQASCRQYDIREELYRERRSIDTSLWSDPAYHHRKQREARARADDHQADAFRYSGGGYANDPFRNGAYRSNQSWDDGVSSSWNDRSQKMYGDETYAKIWETLFGNHKKPNGFDAEYVRKSRQAAQERVNPNPAGEYRAGKSYSDVQRQAIDKARKARNLRDDDRCDPGTRDNAGRMVFKLLNAHALTEWDLM